MNVEGIETVGRVVCGLHEVHRSGRAHRLLTKNQVGNVAHDQGNSYERKPVHKSGDNLIPLSQSKYK